MVEKEWFETWFDSPFYHLLYNHRDENEAKKFIDNLVAYLKLPKQSAILDIGCGKGRHAKTFAEYGFKVSGIDLSCESISYANEKYAAENLEFIKWDMRENFRENAYDLVVNLFSSFGYFDDEKEDLAVLKAMNFDLKAGGFLVIDYMNPEAILKEMKPKEIINRNEVQFHIQKGIQNGFIKKQIDFIFHGENYHFEERLKIIKPETFINWLETVGFKLQAIFGDYDLAEFSTSHSKRQILIAQKIRS